MTVRSMEWGYRIDVKKDWDLDEITKENTSIACNQMVIELNRIKAEVSRSRIEKNQRERIQAALEEIIDHFEFCRDLANGKIEEKEWDNYSFNGNFKEMFDSYLDELYNLADERILVENPNCNIDMKFLWVG